MAFNPYICMNYVWRHMVLLHYSHRLVKPGKAFGGACSLDIDSSR